MGDRTIVRRLFESTIGESNPQMTDASAEAVKVVQHRRAARGGMNLNASTTNLVVDLLSTTQLSDVCSLLSFELVPTQTVTSSATNFVVVTLWKRAADGTTKTTIAEINTANLAASANLYTAMSANIAQYASNGLTVARGGTIGIDAALTAAGQSGLADCYAYVTLRAD